MLFYRVFTYKKASVPKLIETEARLLVGIIFDGIKKARKFYREFLDDNEGVNVWSLNRHGVTVNDVPGIYQNLGAAGIEPALRKLLRSVGKINNNNNLPDSQLSPKSTVFYRFTL